MRDACPISAAQRTEHHEIAAYGTVCALAAKIGENDFCDLLRETLGEESQTDLKLAVLSETVNEEAEQASSSDGEKDSAAKGTQDEKPARVARKSAKK